MVWELFCSYDQAIWSNYFKKIKNTIATMMFRISFIYYEVGNSSVYLYVFYYLVKSAFIIILPGSK